LARGDNVFGTVRSETARGLRRHRARRSVGMLLDVTDEAAVQATVAIVEPASNGIDILVNNAGYAWSAALKRPAWQKSGHSST